MTEKELLHIIGRFSKEEGYTAYVVGGYLRNEYLGMKSKDFDITVVGNGIKFARELDQSLKIRKPVVYEKFGTAMLTIGEYEVEIVTAREESYLPESRKPIVKKGDSCVSMLGSIKRIVKINWIKPELNQLNLTASVVMAGESGDSIIITKSNHIELYGKITEIVE